MPRRVSLPGAAELFRTTPAGHPQSDAEKPAEAVPDKVDETATALSADLAADDVVEAEAVEPVRPRRRTAGSGRVRHEEKITVYVSSDELLDLERARLSLRAEHKMAVDRGRIVRAALAMALGDLKDHGQQSELVRRLTEQ